MPFIKYSLNGRMTVHNETAHLYRFWDATLFAEYLYSCVEQAIRHDLQEEIGFLRVFDDAVQRTMNIVDMPDRRASLLVRLILQNKGKLARGRRKDFSELSEAEIETIESACPFGKRIRHCEWHRKCLRFMDLSILPFPRFVSYCEGLV
jgi:hypothetical protein